MSKKLLLADDSVTIQKVIQITFAHEDYDLTVTDNGDAALDKAREVKPDLVLADVYMPGKNGYELCSALKQDPALQGTPVLLLTGSFEPFDEDKARAVKADAWLEKPFESQTLLDKVAELLASAETAADEDTAAQDDTESLDDFTFEEEPAAEQTAGATSSADDWSDLSDFVESAAGEIPAPEEISAEAFAEPRAEQPEHEEEPAAAVAETSDEDDMFIFEDELPEEDAPPVVASEPGGFDTDDDIMALDDEDILGAEELEPLDEEPTLAAWSREDFVAEEASLEDFDAPVEDFGTMEEDISGRESDEGTTVPTAPSEEEASPQAEEPAFTEELSVAEPDFSTTSAEESVQKDFAEEADEAETAFAPTEADAEPAAAPPRETGEIESRAAALSEAEIEAIVEKVAGKVIEKMAGTILERIAWEVVPDLAESLIREEINKIKETAA